METPQIQGKDSKGLKLSCFCLDKFVPAHDTSLLGIHMALYSAESQKVPRLQAHPTVLLPWWRFLQQLIPSFPSRLHFSQGFPKTETQRSPRRIQTEPKQIFSQSHLKPYIYIHFNLRTETLKVLVVLGPSRLGMVAHHFTSVVSNAPILCFFETLQGQVP